ncbi:hypothetical protein P8452_61280 [Trifolium repens]|nr:hypothetical protein P8452_61280 [Trifolium repens]
MEGVVVQNGGHVLPGSWATNRYENNQGNYLEQIRGSLMVVATVIASLTFQIAINPPGGVWQSNTNSQNGCAPNKICKAVFCTVGAYVTSIWMILDPLDGTIYHIVLYYGYFWGAEKDYHPTVRTKKKPNDGINRNRRSRETRLPAAINCDQAGSTWIFSTNLVGLHMNEVKCPHMQQYLVAVLARVTTVRCY